MAEAEQTLPGPVRTVSPLDLAELRRMMRLLLTVLGEAKQWTGPPRSEAPPDLQTRQQEVSRRLNVLERALKELDQAADAASTQLAVLSRPRITRAAELLGAIDLALVDKLPLRWSESQRVYATRLLQRVGVVLLSRAALKRRRHEPKRGAVPVAEAYFGAPIQRHVELFVFGIQTRPLAGTPAHEKGARRQR